jgi:2-polyprenyl-3-methyl-5-hydroxy-6-metoxy-1,4-benzoquinol methylase
LTATEIEIGDDQEHCPLCGAGTERHETFERVSLGDHSIDYDMCRNCGFVFQPIRLNLDQQASFYETKYRTVVQGSEQPTDKDLRIQSGRARNIAEYAQRYLTTVKRHLDIGSSSGALLRTISSAFECESVGIEPGNAYREYSQERGASVFPSLAHLEHTAFDLITMSHVLEHLGDPVGYLSELRERWLLPNGHMILEVPNLYGHFALEISHLTAFAPATMRETLRRAGFESTRLSIHGRPRSHLLPLYILAITTAGDLGTQATPVRSRSTLVRQRRAIGNLWRRLLTRGIPGQAWLPLPELDEVLDG